MTHEQPPLPPLRAIGENLEREPVGIDGTKLREIRPHEMLIRFAFGFAVSVIAGTITLLAGNRAGGLFLAFPAILPASLTLIEAKSGKRQADVDAAGATMGAVALIAFAVVSLFAIGSMSLAVAQLVALAAWLTVAIALYAAARVALRPLRRKSGASRPAAA